MTELTEFLLARIAEDERAALAVPPLEYNYDMGGNRQDERFVFDRTLPSSADGMGNWSKHRHSPTTAAHFTRHDPRRVLAECEAKRRTVRTMQTALNQAWQDGPTRPVIEYLAQRTLRLLAAPYKDHPDYDEEWKI